LNFEAFNFHHSVAAGAAAAGYEISTPIQALATHSGEAFTLVTGEDKDMVRAINRIIGSEVDQRILSTFNYGSPTPNREGRSQWIGKPQRKLSEVKKRWNKTKSLPKSFI
jgi:hypothetical protein